MKILIVSLLLFLAAPVMAAESKIVHVIVALCDNKYQGIVPVSKALGNGQDPANNLYWGAMYGVKSFMPKAGWKLLSTEKDPAKHILERIVLQKDDVIIIADAYDGRYIKESVEDLFSYAAGKKMLTLNSQAIMDARLEMLVFIGHNAFLDNRIKVAEADAAERQENARLKVSVFACYSKQHFLDRIKATGAAPYILTTSRMAPEAYNLDALISAWRAGKGSDAIHEAVAEAYHKYQKSGMKGARALFYYE